MEAFSRYRKLGEESPLFDALEILKAEQRIGEYTL